MSSTDPETAPKARRWTRATQYEHRPAGDAPPAADPDGPKPPGPRPHGGDFPAVQTVHVGTTPQGGLVEPERGEGAAEHLPAAEKDELQRYADRYGGPGASGFRSGQDLLLPHERARIQAARPAPIVSHPRTQKRD